MNKNIVVRQRKIKEIILKYDVSTQDELSKYLEEVGIKVTQATLSRDVNEMGLKKTPNHNGKIRYILENTDENKNTGKFVNVYKNSIRDIKTTENLVIIKTLMGAAQAVCSFIDSLNYSFIAGSIAGDDTIFVAPISTEYKDKIVEELRSYF